MTGSKQVMLTDTSEMQGNSYASSSSQVFSSDNTEAGLKPHLPVVVESSLEASKMQASSVTAESSTPKVYYTADSKVQPTNQLFPQNIMEGAAETKNCQGDSFTSSKTSEAESEFSFVKKRCRKRKEKDFHSVTKVATLVFFDLETTGLAFQIGKPNVQITEISMIAMNRKEFEQSTYDDLRDVRIIQKLCLCTRPRSMVSSDAAAITGLNNEKLMDQNPFEHSTAEAINCFLSHLSKPVCLIAHNGINYDFPLLKAEFSRLSMSLPSDILIADTLKAFRVLGVPVFPPEKKVCKLVKFTKKGRVSYSLSNLHLYFFNKNPPGSHSSEGDCVALAMVCHQMKDLMLLWIDENCKIFDSVSPMW